MEDPEDIPGPGEPGFDPDLWEECEEEEESLIIFFWKVVLSLVAIVLVAYFFWFLEQNKKREKDKCKKAEEKEEASEAEKLLGEKSSQNLQQVSDSKSVMLVSNGVSSEPSKETIIISTKRVLENGVMSSSPGTMRENNFEKSQLSKEEYLSEVIKNDGPVQKESWQNLDEPTSEDLRIRKFQNEFTGQDETPIIRVSEQFSNLTQPTNEDDQTTFTFKPAGRIIPIEVDELHSSQKTSEPGSQQEQPQEDLKREVVAEIPIDHSSQSEILVHSTTINLTSQPKDTDRAGDDLKQKSHFESSLEQAPIKGLTESSFSNNEVPSENVEVHFEQQTWPPVQAGNAEVQEIVSVQDKQQLFQPGDGQQTEKILIDAIQQEKPDDDANSKLKKHLSSPLQQSQEGIPTEEDVQSEAGEIHLRYDEEQLSTPSQNAVYSEVLQGDQNVTKKPQTALSDAGIDQPTKDGASHESITSNNIQGTGKQSHDDFQLTDDDRLASFGSNTSVKTKLIIQTSDDATSPLNVLLKDKNLGDNANVSTDEATMDRVTITEDTSHQKVNQPGKDESITVTTVIKQVETLDSEIPPSDKVPSEIPTTASMESSIPETNTTIKLLPETLDIIQRTSVSVYENDNSPAVCSESNWIDNSATNQKPDKSDIESAENELPAQTEVSEFITLKAISSDSASPMIDSGVLVEKRSYETSEMAPKKSEMRTESDKNINLLTTEQAENGELGDSGVCIKTISGAEKPAVFSAVESAENETVPLPNRAENLSPVKPEDSKIMEKSAESSKTVTSESLHAQADSLDGEFTKDGAIRMANVEPQETYASNNESSSIIDTSGKLKLVQPDSTKHVDEISNDIDPANEMKENHTVVIRTVTETSSSGPINDKPARPSDEVEPQIVAMKRGSTRASSDAMSGSVDEMSIDRSLQKVKVTAEQKEHLDENFEQIRSKIMHEVEANNEVEQPLQQQTTTILTITRPEEGVSEGAIVENAAMEAPVQVIADLPIPPADQWEVEASVSISLPSSSVDEMPDVTTAPEIESYAERAGSAEIQDLPNDESQAEQQATNQQAAPAFVGNTSRPKSFSKITRKSPTQLDVDVAVTAVSPSPPSSPHSPHQKVSSMLEVLGTSSLTEALMKIQTLQEVSEVMRKAGLQSSNLIFGIDYTASNKYQGENSFGGKSLHSIEAGVYNPYQQVIRIMGKTLAPFATSGYIPAFGFGDVHTSDWSVFPLKKDSHCTSFDELMEVYNRMTPKVILSGPTNFAPLILQAIDICKMMGDYHILVIVADGQVTNERATRRAIVDACRYPLSIIVVGVGDGPWDMMRVFDESLPKRPWDNFHFVEFGQIAKDNDDFDLEFAIESLLEIPDQYKKIKRLGLLNRSLSPVGNK